MFHPEIQSVLNYLKSHKDVELWPKEIEPVSSPIPRNSSSAAAELSVFLTDGQSQPTIIADACASWPAIKEWSFEYFQTNFGSSVVLVNDRAPARHADALSSTGKQHTISLSLNQYISKYIHPHTSTLTENQHTKPYYLNGWRAFSEFPSLSVDAPIVPEFAVDMDHTQLLLEALDKALFGNNNKSPSDWCKNVSLNLSKLFIGPPGTVTRFHYDAGDAHGWLAQIVGRKFFILVPPTDGCYLYPLESEIETAQSPIDPLNCDRHQFPEYAEKCRVHSGIVYPGEAIVIPKGWWHYAVALDKSITVQRNFYHARSNASGLVNMVLKSVKKST